MSTAYDQAVNNFGEVPTMDNIIEFNKELYKVLNERYPVPYFDDAFNSAMAASDGYYGDFQIQFDYLMNFAAKVIKSVQN